MNPDGGESTRPLSCDEVRSRAAEIALAIVGGPERSAALSHLDCCAACRSAVDQLAPAADTLLLMAGEVDPPVGFEVRLLERLRRESSPQPPPRLALRAAALLQSRKWRLSGAVAAAMLAAIGSGVAVGEAIAPATPAAVQGGAGGVTGPRGYGGSSGGSGLANVEVRALRSGSQTAGEVLLTRTTPEWLLMSVRDLHVSAWVSCVVSVSGRVVSVGTFQLQDGQGTWSVRLPRSWALGDVTDARVVGPGGAVLASATL